MIGRETKQNFKEKDREKDDDIRSSDSFGMDKSMVKLQSLGLCLKGVVSRLPDSRAKEYLLEEVLQMVKFKATHDFYHLRNKISWMINMSERSELGGEVMELLDEIKIEINEIVQRRGKGR
jgi:hypothetical protein